MKYEKTSKLPRSTYWGIHSRLPDVIARANRPKDLVIRPRVTTEPKPAPVHPISNTVLDTADRRNRKVDHEQQQAIDVSTKKRAGLEPDSEPITYATATTSLPPVIQNYDATSAAEVNGGFDKDVPEKQRSETVEAFLARLPPSRSDIETHGPWLWIHNPDRKSRSTKASDEGDFMEKAEMLLYDFKTLENKTRESMPGKASGTITRKLTPKRKELEQNLLNLAKETGCVSGKWMLFPLMDDLDRVWRAVCKGVDSGKLGTTAKIATNGGEVRNEGEANLRLICVYTKDFSDERDVRRVLDALLEMKLVKLPEDDMGHGIYYKCDAYTYLNLGSGNDYKIKASIYSSKEMLKGIKWKD